MSSNRVCPDSSRCISSRIISRLRASVSMQEVSAFSRLARASRSSRILVISALISAMVMCGCVPLTLIEYTETASVGAMVDTSINWHTSGCIGCPPCGTPGLLSLDRSQSLAHSAQHAPIHAAKLLHSQIHQVCCESE